MKESNLKLAQKDIDEALNAIELMEQQINNSDSSKQLIKEKFIFLANKMEKIEGILKEEGLLD